METNVLIKPNTTYQFTVESSEAFLRLDVVIAGRFPEHSRSFFKNLIEKECVFLNGQKVVKQGARVKVNDLISIFSPTEKKNEGDSRAASLPVQVLFEHEHFLVINKPAGLNVHSPGQHYCGVSLVDWLVSHYNIIAQEGYNDRPGIVHRLDKDTSGIMLIARTAYAHAYLSEQFKLRTIQKTYRAVVQGHPNQDGTIDFMIGRHPVKRCKMAHVKYSSPAIAQNVVTGYLHVSGVGRVRHALSHYRVIDYLPHNALIEVKPVTGRTHQIRVHCAGIGHPLVGDFLYGKVSSLIGRQALHAYSISFEFGGQEYHFQVDPPEDFQQLLACLKDNK